MSRRATPLLVEDIWEAIEKIERYVGGLDHDAFIKDDKTIDSVVRNLEIIGEAANRLPENFRALRSEIEWRGSNPLAPTIFSPPNFLQIGPRSLPHCGFAPPSAQVFFASNRSRNRRPGFGGPPATICRDS
jgi:hypothetical protein